MANLSSSLIKQASSVKWRWFLAGCSCLLAGSCCLGMIDLQGAQFSVANQAYGEPDSTAFEPVTPENIQTE